MITDIHRTVFSFTKSMVERDGIEIKKIDEADAWQLGVGFVGHLAWGAFVSGWSIYLFSVDADAPSEEDIALVEELIRRLYVKELD